MKHNNSGKLLNSIFMEEKINITIWTVHVSFTNQGTVKVNNITQQNYIWTVFFIEKGKKVNVLKF